MYTLNFDAPLASVPGIVATALNLWCHHFDDDHDPSMWRTGNHCSSSSRTRTSFRKGDNWPIALPCMLLHCNGDLPRALPDCECPTQHLLGRDESGAFRTAQAEEYPSALSLSFAHSVSDRLRVLSFYFWSSDADPELQHFIRLSACLECGKVQPDYQPR